MAAQNETVKTNNPAANPVAAVGRLLRRLLLSEYFVLILSIVYFIALLPFVNRLGSIRNLSVIFSNVWPLLTVAIGQTFILIIGGIDLSQTAIMAMSSVLGAAFMSSAADPLLFDKSPLWGIILSEKGGLLAGSPLAVPVGIGVMLLVGVAIGALNGFAVARFRMPPFMVTLVTLSFFSAFAILLTRSENIRNLPPEFLILGKTSLRADLSSFLSWSLGIGVGLAVVAQIILSRTKFGRWLYAIGTNQRAALISGVPTQRIIILAYMFSGFCAAVGSILYSSRLEGGRPTLAQNLLLDVVGATVIGGTSLFGGKGKVLWTLFGVLFFVLLSNTLNLLNVSTFTIDIVKGSVILAAALLDVLRIRLLARS